MQIKGINIVICFLSVALIVSCKKDQDPPTPRYYIKATINGEKWETNGVAISLTPDNNYLGFADLEGKHGMAFDLPSAAIGEYPFEARNSENINPLQLLSLTVEPFKSALRVKWSTAQETNIKKFVVQVGEWDPANLSDADSINALGSGDNNYQYDHYYLDPFMPKFFFRLRIVENNGTSSYSQVKVINVLNVAFYTKVNGTQYEFYKGYGGSIKITSKDEANKIITGTFSFQVTYPNGETIDVTNGEFKAPYL